MVIEAGCRERKALEMLAKLFELCSKNGCTYTVENVWQDFGAGIMWTNIIGTDRKGDRWQVLDPSEQARALTADSVEDFYLLTAEVMQDKYFPDK